MTKQLPSEKGKKD